VVVAEGVCGRDRLRAVVDRRRADEAIRSRASQRADGACEALLRQPLRLTGSRAEAGAPEQALGLSGTERSAIDGEGAGRDVA
jgi:hypothetical protein